jgi:DNA-binding transcriptional regulator YiaG
MENKKVLLNRENKITEELQATAYKKYKGLNLDYIEVFYVDYEVNEDTGLINRDKTTKHYTKKQIERNIKALKNAYNIAKGAASPLEIINFRNKYQISASTFSIILGFSKNTISNIENEGITSLPSGRLIKMCLENKNIIYQYLQLSDDIDKNKKVEISRRLMEEII